MNSIVILDIIGLSFAFAFIVILLTSPNKTNRTKSIIIACLVLLSLLLVQNLIIIEGHPDIAKYIVLICFPMYYLIYPLIFIYIKTLVNGENKIKLFPSHFLLALIVFVSLASLFFSLPEQDLDSLIIHLSNYDILHDKAANYLIALQILYYAQVIYFINLFIKLYNRSKTQHRKTYNALWIKMIIIFLIIYEISYFLIWLITKNVFFVDIILTDIAILLLGIIALKHEQILLRIHIGESFANNPLLSSERKIKSKLSEGKKKEVINELKDIIIGEELYLNPGLKIGAFAKRLHIPEKEISIIINDSLGKNFSSFINEYRIKKACDLLTNSNIKISDISFKVGFYSRSAFTNTFKDFKGVTPSAYREINF